MLPSLLGSLPYLQRCIATTLLTTLSLASKMLLPIPNEEDLSVPNLNRGQCGFIRDLLTSFSSNAGHVMLSMLLVNIHVRKI